MRLAAKIALGGLRGQWQSGRAQQQQLLAVCRPFCRPFSEFYARATEGGVEKTMLSTILAGNVDELVRLLETKEIAPNHRFADLRHCTPLMLAAEYNKLDIVQTLLDNGADPNLQDDFGDTAAMIAAREKSREALNALIAKGAQLDILNYENMSAADCTLDPSMDKEMRRHTGEGELDRLKDI